jgi:hypothetical protein
MATFRATDRAGGSLRRICGAIDAGVSGERSWNFRLRSGNLQEQKFVQSDFKSKIFLSLERCDQPGSAGGRSQKPRRIHRTKIDG